MKLTPIAALTLSAMMLSGCASIPKIANDPSSSAHPQLHHAINQIPFKDSYTNCSEEPFNQHDCQMGVLLDSVGPAPLLVLSSKTDITKDASSGSGMRNVMGAASIGNGIAGGGGIGGIAIGLFLMAGSSSSHQPPAGLEDFRLGDLYAVTFSKNQQQSNVIFEHAVHREVTIPARFAGQLLGWSGYTVLPPTAGLSWRPKNLHAEVPGFSTYAVYYTSGSIFQPHQVLAPVAVFRNDLRPMRKIYSVTNEWTWSPSVQYAARKGIMAKLSTAFPHRTFVSYLGHASSVVCKAGGCHTLHFSPYPARSSN